MLFALHHILHNQEATSPRSCLLHIIILVYILLSFLCLTLHPPKSEEKLCLHWSPLSPCPARPLGIAGANICSEGTTQTDIGGHS